MVSLQGYFEGDRFVSAHVATIPQHKRTIVTVLDEAAPELKNGKAWRVFFEGLQSCPEEAPVTFERTTFQREVQI
jgi:hypothetical protein